MKRYDMGRLGEMFGRTPGAGQGGAGPSRQPGKRSAWRVGLPILVVVAITGCLVLAAIGGSQGTPLADHGGGIQASQPAPTVAAAAPGALGLNNQNSSADKTLPGAPAMAQAPASGSQPGGPVGSTANEAQTQQANWDRMIIRTATMQLTVQDVLAAVDSVSGVAVRYGGRIMQMDTHQDGDSVVSTVTIQVPSGQFDRMMTDLHKLGGQVKKVVSENVSSQDVTGEYTDLQSQLRNLQATEARMLALQQKADTLDNILTIDQQLRQVQGQIEQIQGRINYLSKSSDMSTVTVTLTPEALAGTPPAPVSANAWDPAQIALQAWNASVDLLEKFASVVIAVAVFMWWAVPLLLLAFVLAVRSRRRQPSAPQAPGGGNA